MKKSVILLLLFFVILNIYAEDLIIFHAGSLTNVLHELSKAFEQEYPKIDVKLVAAGSLVVARKITELHQIADLAFVADYTIIPEFLYDHYANYNVVFSNNSIVLAYTNKSKYCDLINKNNWYEIIFKKGVLFGHSNPDLDPAGYRTLMVMKLAEDFYSKNELFEKFINAKNKFILKKSIDLVAYLEAGELDYAFLYKSVAFQYNLKYLELPDEINLSSDEYKENYKKVSVEVPGKDGNPMKIFGKPINFSFTILKNAQNKKAAIEFVKFMYSDKGRKIFKENGMELFVLVDNPDNLPEELKEIWGF
ncbi:extracellular solute-binding protein [Thermosipho atlanticus]|uniref:Molybdate/tungstate transport system substrate-binding protein n=1 Tax=Thermosipho atlanticus DSM 15807 TaxID=1123380 RepID=A0A1M5T9T2_9BACT|nr:extracellular solute-binding protein [Thermosipho atlanticus]SHH47474.1 molybdate/tungstate transport system substrate-binding protein [Thermosipho atlanticus DSM 15807]